MPKHVAATSVQTLSYPSHCLRRWQPVLLRGHRLRQEDSAHRSFDFHRSKHGDAGGCGVYVFLREPARVRAVAPPSGTRGLVAVPPGERSLLSLLRSRCPSCRPNFCDTPKVMFEAHLSPVGTKIPTIHGLLPNTSLLIRACLRFSELGPVNPDTPVWILKEREVFFCYNNACATQNQ